MRFGRYAVRRLLLSVVALFGVATITFVVLRVLPGDPVLNLGGALFTQAEVEAKREELGLRDPLPVQYVRFIAQSATGDFGVSLRTGRPVLKEIAARAPSTLKLAFASLAITAVLGLGLGVVSATKPRSVIARLTMLLALLGLSTPSFWLGYLLILAFAVSVRILPTGGEGGPQHLILPALTLAAPTTAIVARVVRASLLDVLSADFIRTARGKGLRDGRVWLRHALPNALIPTVTIVGLQFGAFLSGAVIVETVFAWPGLGRLLIEAVRLRDFTVVQATTLIFAASFVTLNLVIDLTYARLDPRISYR